MEEKEDKKKRRAVILLLVLFLCTGLAAVCYIYATQKPAESPKAILTKVVHQDSVEELKPEEKPATHAVAPAPKPAIKTTLKEEIAWLNDDSKVAFDNTFMEGLIYETVLSDYLQKSKTGYVIDLHGGSFLTTPTVCDSSLFISGGFSSRAFYAFDAANGNLKWGDALSDDGPSSCVIVDSMVIFNTESCTVFALNRYTGKLVWAKWIGDPLLTHLATDGDCIYTAYPSMTFEFDPGKVQRFQHIRPSHAIAAMKAKTGDVKWQRWLDGDIMTSPVICGDVIYLTTFSGTLYKIDRSNGKILAAAKLYATTLPTVNKGKIYLGQRVTENGKIREAIVEIDSSNLQVQRTLTIQDAPYLNFASLKLSRYKKECEELDARNGFALTPERTGWKNASKLIGRSNVSSLQNYLGSTMVAEKQRLYSVYGDHVICLDTDSGKVVWSHKLSGSTTAAGGSLATAPILSGDYVVTVTVNGDVLLLDKKTGALARTYPCAHSVRNQPVVSGNKIFVPTEEGQLVQINTIGVSLTDYSMFLKNNAHNIGDQ